MRLESGAEVGWYEHPDGRRDFYREGEGEPVLSLTAAQYRAIGRLDDRENVMWSLLNKADRGDRYTDLLQTIEQADKQWRAAKRMLGFDPRGKG